MASFLFRRVGENPNYSKLFFFPPAEVCIDSCLYQSSYAEVSVKLGEHVPIKVTLVNTSNKTLHLLRLFLIFYQDHPNSLSNNVHYFNIDSKVIVTGCNSICLSEVSLLMFDGFMQDLWKSLALKADIR